MILYRITNTISGKSYIGVTSLTPRIRLGQHFSHAHERRKENSALHGAIRKYGRDAFVVETIGRATDWQSLLAMETVAIQLYCTFAPSGYNLSLGGEGALGAIKSAATRAKISAGNIGKRQTDDARRRIGEGNRGKVVSAEARAKLSAARTGMKFSDEHRANLSRSHKGKGPSPEHMERLRQLALARGRKSRAAREDRNGAV